MYTLDYSPESSPFLFGFTCCAIIRLHVIVDGRVIGTLAVEDEIRPESAEAVKELHDLGVRVAMITGDSQAVADSVAKRIGIDEVAAQVWPADKASAVARFQAGGKRVAMV